MFQTRRFVLPLPHGPGLPLFAESIGYNAEQERVIRPEGYPIYHWIHTLRGEGRIRYEGKEALLPPGSGLLLYPHVPHSYEATGEVWQTFYLTFDGRLVASLLNSLSINETSFFQWEEDSPIAGLPKQMIDRLQGSVDILGIGTSTDIYGFLLTLHKYGKLHQNQAVSRNISKLSPLLSWMEEQMNNPELGLEEMAESARLSARRLNTLFRETFGLSPYGYLLHMRIRKAKELLIGKPTSSVKEIGEAVGFRDSSHFVATFRKTVGTSPEKFRRLH